MASRTFLVTLLTFNLFFSLGCALLEPAPQTTPGPVSKVLTGSYDEIWRAIQKAFVNYPIQVNNNDQGIIETDIIKGEQIWQPPFLTKGEKRNLRYVLRVNTVKGRVRNKDSVRVTVTKTVSLEKDFFSGEVRLQADGLEEKAILYRIERELLLERSLQKAFTRSSGF